MSEHRSTEVAIVGAGVIGLAIAVRLAGEGREVVLIEPNEPGSGASYGNAGTIADYAVSPVGTPAVLRSLPALLLDRDSPLAIRPAALPALAPWLIRFAHQSIPARAKAERGRDRAPSRRGGADLAGTELRRSPRRICSGRMAASMPMRARQRSSARAGTPRCGSSTASSRRYCRQRR